MRTMQPVSQAFGGSTTRRRRSRRPGAYAADDIFDRPAPTEDTYDPFATD
jgi:hypothetical protein